MDESSYSYIAIGIISTLLAAIGKLYADKIKYKKETEVNERDLWTKISEQQTVILEQCKNISCEKCKLEGRVVQLEALAQRVLERYDRRKTKV